MTSLHHHTLPGLAAKSPAISARPYQAEAVRSVIDYWCEGGGNPLVSMATGTGKSVVIAQLVKELESLNPGIRIVMLVHSRELVAQNAAALLRYHPTAHIGINSAGLNRRDTRQPILFASIQSVFRHNADSIGRRDVILIDEAHLTPRKGDGMYRTFLATMKAANPDMRVVGFTATPFRLDSGRLDKGADRLFDDLVYDYGIGRGIEDGYLSPLISKATARTLDVSGVAKRGGEFVEGALQAAIDKDWITQEAVSEIVAMGEDRRSWLVFCAGVDHAIHVRDAIRARGVSCETVTGETPMGERDRMLRDFKAGKLRCLTNVSVLTTGFDAPATDLVAMLRPTLSAGLYIQMVGRGTRLAPGKENCIAEGQRVLTDHGLVPIEHVTTSMRVWDGVEFVAHCGTVFRGEQEVITYAGLEATSDHRVWTKEGWKAFGQCAIEQTPISVAGVDECTVRTAEGRFRTNCQEERSRQTALANRMHKLRFAIIERLYEFAERLCRLSQVRQSSAGPEVAGYAGYCRQAEVHKSQRSEFPRLWWQRNRVSICISNAICGLGSGEFRFAQGDANRPYQQRWSLRTWKPQVRDVEAKYEQSARLTTYAANARFSGEVSRYQVRRFNFGSFVGGWPHRRADHRTVSHAISKTKRRVWDILNAGPRHSFTVEGLLVHNCLVLDFAGNVRRHGPVDAVSVTGGPGGTDGTAKEGDVRAKECPTCATLVALNTRTCPVCAHEWPPLADKPKHEARADASVAILSTEPPAWVPVEDVRFFRHDKPGSHPTLRVEYGSGMSVYRQWLCFEHDPGFALTKAHQWWRQMAGTAPPATVDEALERAGEITPPDEVRVKPNGKYFEIVGLRHRRAA
jgi:superfamily II DNA or RNA helicase